MHLSIEPPPSVVQEAFLPDNDYLEFQEQVHFSPFSQADDIVSDLLADAKLKLEATSVLNDEAAALSGTMHHGPKVDE